MSFSFSFSFFSSSTLSLGRFVCVWWFYEPESESLWEICFWLHGKCHHADRKEKHTTQHIQHTDNLFLSSMWHKDSFPIDLFPTVCIRLICGLLLADVPDFNHVCRFTSWIYFSFSHCVCFLHYPGLRIYIYIYKYTCWCV